MLQVLAAILAETMIYDLELGCLRLSKKFWNKAQLRKYWHSLYSNSTDTALWCNGLFLIFLSKTHHWFSETRQYQTKPKWGLLMIHSIKSVEKTHFHFIMTLCLQGKPLILPKEFELDVRLWGKENVDWSMGKTFWLYEMDLEKQNISLLHFCKTFTV